VPRLPKKSTKYLPFAILIFVILAIVIALIIGSDESKPKPKAVSVNIQNTACGPYRKDGEMVINGQKFNIEIAYSSSSKAKGLAGRPCIPANWGMLFDFGRQGQYAFWMKGMKFPIDIVWINSEHNIATIADAVQPSTYYSKNPYIENDPAHPARYVLEIKANLANDLKLNLGMPVSFQHA
jgi:uncharacterized membrane protein (UPF0127 family)